MLSILAFDNLSMRALLSERFEDHFDLNFPLFYKNRYVCTKNKENRYIQVYRYNNAIDVALENNQISAINLILSHIVKHQNNYVSSFLFN